MAKIDCKAVPDVDRCLCPDVGSVHDNPRSEIISSRSPTRRSDETADVCLWQKAHRPSETPLTRDVDGQIFDSRSLNWLGIEGH